MWRKRAKNIFLNIVGVFFIFIGSIAIGDALLNGFVNRIFWFCYFGMLLIGTGVLFRNSFLIVSQLNIMAIPLIVWTVDFLIFLVNNTFLGITDYFFLQGSLLSKFVSLQHLYTVPLALFCVYLIKLKRIHAWKVSFIYLIIVFIVTRLLTLKVENINCVYLPCFNLPPSLWAVLEPIYPIVWFVIFFIMVLFTNFLIYKMWFLREKKYDFSNEKE